MKKIILLLVVLASCGTKQEPLAIKIIKDFEQNRGQVIKWDMGEFGKPVSYELKYENTKRSKELQDSIYYYTKQSAMNPETNTYHDRANELERIYKEEQAAFKAETLTSVVHSSVTYVVDTIAKKVRRIEAMGIVEEF